MRNKILSSVLVVLFLVCPCFAVENFFKSDAEIGAWYLNYYASPSPQRVIDAILYYGDSSLYQKETSRDQFAIFIATIIKGNPVLLQSAYDELTKSGSENSKIFFLNVLWFADTAESKELIKKAEMDWVTPDILETGEWLLKNPVFDVLDEPITDAHHLDLLWSIFFATGDKAPVKRIISALIFLDSNNMGLSIVGGAARWSLASNLQLHPTIAEICREEVKNAKGTVKKVLSEMLAQNEGQN